MNNWLKNNQPFNFASTINRIFKQQCALCLATPTIEHYALCQPCLNALPYTSSHCCKQCAIPVSHHHDTKDIICGRCLKQAPHYDETQALLRYQFPLNQLLQHYKYKEALYLSQTFGTLMMQRLQFTNTDLIIPMPLHANRLKTRGFNQSIEIAKVIHQQTNIPLDLTNCKKVKDTPPQASLAYKDRIKNIKTAFACNQHYTGLHIAIIDDVMTTGATLNELSRILKQAGAEKVSCYVIARAE